MDKTEAIKRIKDHIRVHRIGEYPHILIAEALSMAVQALATDTNVGDKVEVVQFNALKSLVNGEWVDCKLVQEALGIDFATGLKLFDFSRTAEWNPAPLNGQKITTKFKLKNAVKHGRWQPVDHDGSWRVDMCSICHRRMHYVDYDQPYQYCPNCGAKMECENNA